MKTLYLVISFFYELELSFTLKTHQMFSVHISPEEFLNGSLTLKTHQMFSVHTRPGELKTETISGLLRFVFEENLDRKIT